jgi:hypothetical protein
MTTSHSILSLLSYTMAGQEEAFKAVLELFADDDEGFADFIAIMERKDAAKRVRNEKRMVIARKKEARKLDAQHIASTSLLKKNWRSKDNDLKIKFSGMPSRMPSRMPSSMK